MIRDRDWIYGTIVTRRLRAMGIREMPAAPASPWQNGFAERLIGSIRRECRDHIVVFGEAHLRRILRSYTRYYNRASEHIDHWTKIHRFLARYSGPEASNRFLSSGRERLVELFETRQTGKFGFEVVAIGRARGAKAYEFKSIDRSTRRAAPRAVSSCSSLKS